jgi:hypothetical protein
MILMMRRRAVKTVIYALSPEKYKRKTMEA